MNSKTTWNMLEIALEIARGTIAGLCSRVSADILD
jgi:hypothetical protein